MALSCTYSVSTSIMAAVMPFGCAMFVRQAEKHTVPSNGVARFCAAFRWPSVKPGVVRSTSVRGRYRAGDFRVHFLGRRLHHGLGE